MLSDSKMVEMAILGQPVKTLSKTGHFYLGFTDLEILLDKKTKRKLRFATGVKQCLGETLGPPGLRGIYYQFPASL